MQNTAHSKKYGHEKTLAIQLVLLERKEQRLSPIEDRGIAALPVTGELTSSLATRQGQKSTSITHLTAPKDMERSRPPCPIISELTGQLIEQQKADEKYLSETARNGDRKTSAKTHHIQASTLTHKRQSSHTTEKGVR